MIEPVQPIHIMAKPVCGTCNLQCAYCYYTEKMAELYPGQARFQMDDATLASFVRQYLQLATWSPVIFGWQGGEPTLAGIDFFRRAVALQRQHAPAGLAVANALQTNGTLLDDPWCAFLTENGFLVGLSLDGPPQWHDHYRRDRAGGETFARAWAGLERLRRHRVEFNVLVTLNARNAPHAGDVYRYFVNRGVRWLQFIPILERDRRGQVRDFCCTGEQFGRFMIEVFDVWRERHVGVVSERLIDSVLHTLVNGRATICCNAPRCADAHVLEWNGDLYACDHFVYRHWWIGNIHRTPLDELVRSPRLREGDPKRDSSRLGTPFAALKTDLPVPCRQCQYLQYCQGGCPKHRLRFPATEDRSQEVNYFCEGYKMFFAHALPELKRIAESIRQQEGVPNPDSSGLGAHVPPSAERRSPVDAAPAAKAARPASVAPRCTSGSRLCRKQPQAGRSTERSRRSRLCYRNSPCPCGSGRKYKQCCGRK